MQTSAYYKWDLFLNRQTKIGNQRRTELCEVSSPSSFRTEPEAKPFLFYRHFERSPGAKRRGDVRNLTAFSAPHLEVGVRFLTHKTSSMHKSLQRGRKTTDCLEHSHIETHSNLAIKFCSYKRRCERFSKNKNVHYISKDRTNSLRAIPLRISMCCLDRLRACLPVAVASCGGIKKRICCRST